MFSSRNRSGQVIKNGAIVPTFRQSVCYSNLSSLPPSGKFSDGITAIDNAPSSPAYSRSITVLSTPPSLLSKEEVVNKAIIYSLNLFRSPESKDLVLSNEGVSADIRGLLFVSSILLTSEGKYRGKASKFLHSIEETLSGKKLNEFYLNFSVHAWGNLRSKPEKNISNTVDFLFFMTKESLNKVLDTHVFEKESKDVIYNNYMENIKNTDHKLFFNSAVDRCITGFLNIN